jgi:Geranylgeranyl pyrophosphate synthase
MENSDLSETDLEDYENMIEGKTGALYSGGVEMMVETHLENEDYSERQRCSLDNNEVHSLFTEYMDSFNKLFQAGDDMLEVFNSNDVEKSTSDIKNRKITFPALNTKYGLEDENSSYAEAFLNIFDRNYDEIAKQTIR